MGQSTPFPIAGLIGVINLANEKPGTLRYASDVDAARRLAGEYHAAGFAAIDLGAQSSHYSVRRMSGAEQIDILAPVVLALVEDGHNVAVETEIPGVAGACAEAGAGCLNLSGGIDNDDLLGLIAAHDLTCITSFTPRDSPQDVDAVDIDRDLRGQYLVGLAANVDRLTGAGVSRLIVDAGIGYSYRMPYRDFARYQVDTIRDTPALTEAFSRPTLVAVPRIADEWLVAAFATLAMECGASLLRCHDPAVGEIGRLLGFLSE